MMKFFICVFSVFSLSLFSQDLNKSYIGLPKDLTENANAIFTEHQVNITYESRRKIVTESKYVVTFLNRKGFDLFNKNIYYTKSIKVKKAKAVVYDANGKVIKKINKSDFKDFSFLDGYSIISDARVLALDYVPTSYPFTLEWYAETESANTAFMKTWNPIQQVYNSVLKASLTIEFPEDIGFFYEENALASYEFKKEKSSHKLVYEFNNLEPIVPEDLQPSFQTIMPAIFFGISKFHLEGIDGTAENWQELGLWIDTHLLKDTENLPEKTKAQIRDIVGTETDPLKKAALVYKFVQDNTRYISIQLGIGGWKPMLASDVDRLKYGDCKALTNYTQQLLKAVDVPSYYTVVYGDSDKRSLNHNIVALQGNHAFLAIPHQDQMYWLECTSQDNPFGFIGDFTDDREVLVITPEGGKIFKTTSLPPVENQQRIEAICNIDETGTLQATLDITSKGLKFDGKQRLDSRSPRELDAHYVDFFSGLKSIHILSTDFTVDFNTIMANEKIQLKSLDFWEKRGNDYIISPNVFSRILSIPPRVRNRKYPFEIARGYKEVDDILIEIPNTFQLTFLPESATLSSEFGSYEIKFNFIQEGLKYQRVFVLNEGIYDKEKYESYRDFITQVIHLDNLKAILQLK